MRRIVPRPCFEARRRRRRGFARAASRARSSGGSPTVRTKSGEGTASWSRATLAFARTADGWRITHFHDSAPFHMDGSMPAALDLEPAA